MLGNGPIETLPIATIIRPFADVTGGLKGTNKIGGLAVYGSKLYWTYFVYYDASAQVQISHGYCNLDFSNPKGIFELKKNQEGLPRAGQVAGYFITVPERWQDDFDYPMMSGQAGIPIVSRTSSGPCAVGFDPRQLGTVPAPNIPYLLYPEDHPLAPMPQQSTLWNFSSKVNGGVCSDILQKECIMFIGSMGTGPYWYGEANAGPNGTIDTAQLEHGGHAPPYQSWSWFYNKSDFLLVKNGIKKPWEIVPYWSGPLSDQLYPNPKGSLGGCAYDQCNKRLYIVQTRVDHPLGSYQYKPVIHCFQIS